MPSSRTSRWCLLCATVLLFLTGPVAAQQNTVVPQTALSPCTAVSIISREPLVAGTGLAVSADGHWLALYVHTNRGGEVTLRPREGGEPKQIELTPPTLPPGVIWRVYDAVFSPSSDLLAVRSLGAVWVIDVAEAKTLYQVDFESESQVYPGKISLAGNTLAILFWPAESYLADAPAKKGVEARFYEATTGKLLRSLPLAVESSEAWTEMRLSPDASRIAILRRATRWPGKAALVVYSAEDGKALWETKISAEDFRWSADGNSIYALGGHLLTLDAASGKTKSESRTEYGPSEFQKLRVNEAANLAVGQFSRYSSIKRRFGKSGARDVLLVLWQLSGVAPICATPLPPTQSVQPWLTSEGDIIVLEEVYEVRPPLRLLKSAQLVTYRLAPK